MRRGSRPDVCAILCTQVTAVFLAFAAVWMMPARAANAATAQQVEGSIRRGVQFLYSTQKNGNWEHIPARDPSVQHDFSYDGQQWGMATASATYALLTAGENPADPRLSQAIEFLRKADIIGIYPLGMRCLVWQQLPASKENKASVLRDLNLLLRGSLTGPKNRGLFDYTCPPKVTNRILLEQSGFGMLGMKALADAGMEVPDRFWSAADRAWRANQNPDGGWSYVGIGQPSVESASGSGVAALFITSEFLQRAGTCTGNRPDEARERGLKYIGNIQLNEKTELHWMYLVQRIASASALKYFGNMDWYAQMSNLLVRMQAADGHWTDIINHLDQSGNDVVGTGYCTAILAYGRAPLVANKLKYETGQESSRQEGHWNQRPRDLANVVQWIGRQMERPLNWQIVDFKSSLPDLLESPILYLAGNEKLSFTSAEKEQLRNYVTAGGLIVATADCASREFSDSFRSLASELFPAYEFRNLPADHVIFTGQQFPIAKADTLKVQALGNGAREYMVLLGSGDVGKAWQGGSPSGREDGFKLMADLFQYAAGKASLRYKGESYYTTPDAKAPIDRRVAVARLQFAGAWDPEPGGWQRLAALLHNTQKADVTTIPIKLGAGALDAGKYKVAHLTSAAPFTLGKGERDEIKSFVNAGGTLIVDAAGGSALVGASLETEMTAIFGATGETLAIDNPIYKSPVDVSAVRFRFTQGAKTGQPRLRGIKVNGRIGVYYSAEDFSVALIGSSVDGVAGYEPKSAEGLLTNLLVKAAER